MNYKFYDTKGDNRFILGKYKNEKIEDVYKKDPAYITWCLSHINGFYLPTDLVKVLKPDSVITRFTLSTELIATLSNMDDVANKLLLLHDTEICGDIQALKLSDNSESIDVIAYKEVGKNKWGVAKVGKIVSRILKNNLITNSEREIETFVNSYKARLFMKKVDFKIVSGKDIKKYYHQDSYNKDENSGGGTLHQSCMKGSHCQSYFKIYTKNDQVNMLILKYKDSDKIIGRAIIWKDAKISSVCGNVTANFMDRIYYTHDFLVNIFIEWAKKNFCAYKKFQNNDINSPIMFNGKEYTLPFVRTMLDSTSFDTYPYMDTMCYIWKNNVISNKEAWFKDSDTKNVDVATLRSTGGERTGYFNHSY